MNAAICPDSLGLQVNASAALTQMLRDLKMPPAPPPFRHALEFALPVLVELLTCRDE